ncbi:MAG: hypothetical protein H6741_35190 [Alphaproteobacteria bacterium]|nr:hypothetical protein [Alphaproteobacteria bacterium]
MAWCAGGALGRDPHLRGAAQVTARYDAEGKAEEVQVQGEGDEVLHGCLGAQAKRLLLREGAATVTWTVPLDPRHVSPGAVLRGNGYSVGYTDPAPELPALMLALGFPEPIDGAPEHAALAEALAASPHGCGELLPPMAPRPIGVLSSCSPAARWPPPGCSPATPRARTCSPSRPLRSEPPDAGRSYVVSY